MTDAEQLVAWMIAHGFATGHGDTAEDLLKELAWQVEERVRQARLEELKSLLTLVHGTQQHIPLTTPERCRFQICVDINSRIAALERQQ